MATSSARIEGFATVREWGAPFGAYVAGSDPRLPRDLVEEAAGRYGRLCESQGEVRLLHGDLQHYNVLLDSERGWLAVDPKGVVGETEYELGAVLRNPYEALDEFARAPVIERRIDRLEAMLGIDRDRVLGWAFSQAVLAAVWELEDGASVEGAEPFLGLARTLRTMLGDVA